MPIYDMKELYKMGKTPAKCPICVKGPIKKDWDKMYTPIRSRLWTEKKVGEDANGDIRKTVFHRVIECGTHGAVIVEDEL